MDIYLLRNGEQTGPFSDAAVQDLLKSGDTTLDDFAWRDGLPTWQPLHAVLYPKSATQKILPPPPADAPTPTPEPFLSPVLSEPATARQKAFLTFLGISFTGDATKERAAVLLNDAAEDPKHTARIKRWEIEKLRLHPDLFAEEIQARKENRSQHFLDICLTEGADFFHDVTKAHTQVLVGYLDVQHPHWDENADASRYFFAALAEKFPQLVKSGARGQIKFPDGPKAAGEMERSGVAVRSRKKRSPIAAALRGIGFGLLVLAALYGANTFYERHIADSAEADLASSAQPDVPLPTTPVAEVKKKRHPKPATPVAVAENEPAAPPTATPAPVVPIVVEATPMTAAATPAPAPTAPEAPPAVPTTAAATPAPAAIPMLLDPAALQPPPAPAAATPAPRTSVKITKATLVSLRFGSSTLAAGTVVPLVSVDGVNAMVRFGPDVIPVPVANTDLNAP